MEMNIAEVLTELCSLSGPSGFEKPVTERIMALLEPYTDEVRTDVIGNVLGVRRCGKKDAVKLLFDAHIDEVGFIVTGAEEGFLRFAALGGLDARMLPATRVKVLTDPPMYGVICTMPPHVLKKEDAKNTTKIEDLCIDVGLAQDEADKAVQPGTPGVLDCGVRQFGERSLCGKALDDRAGFSAILRALELLKDAQLDADLYVMASVQEEVGVRGAAPGVFAIAPDYSVVIDVGFAKTPDTKPHETQKVLGGGVIISRGPNMNPTFTEKVVKLAQENDIKHQINVEPGGNSGTNARAIQISQTGVAVALLSIPQKYMHSPREVVMIDDVESAAQLMCMTAKTLKGGEMI